MVRRWIHTIGGVGWTGRPHAEKIKKATAPAGPAGPCRVSRLLRAGQFDPEDGFARLHQVEAVAGDGFEVFPVVAQEV